MGLAIIVPGVSFADTNLGKVTMRGDVPIQGLRVVAEDAYSASTVQMAVSYFPLNTTQRGVSWSIVSGGSYATINSASGLLTIAPGTSYKQVSVRATSTSDTTIYADKTITVSYVGGGNLWNEALADSDFGPLMSGMTKKYELSAPKTYNGQQASGDAVTQPLTGLNNYVILFEATFGTNPVTSSLAPCVYSRVSDNANFSKASDRASQEWAADTKFISSLPIHPGVVDGNKYKILICFNRAKGIEYVKNLTTGQMYEASNFSGGGTLRTEFYLGGGSSNLNNFAGTIHQFFLGE